MLGCCVCFMILLSSFSLSERRCGRRFARSRESVDDADLIYIYIYIIYIYRRPRWRGRWSAKIDSVGSSLTELKVVGIFSRCKIECRKARERELATVDENRRVVGMLNPMR